MNKTVSLASSLVRRGLLGTVLGARGSSVGHTGQIVQATDALVLETGQILGSATADRHHTVLLGVVALTGDVRGHDLAGRQADSACFTVGRVGLLGLENHDTQDDAALERAAVQIGGAGSLGLLALEQGFEVAAAGNLVDGRVAHLLCLLGLNQYPAGSRRRGSLQAVGQLGGL